MGTTHFGNKGLSLDDSIKLVVDIEDEVWTFEHRHVFPIISLLEMPLKLSELRH